MASATVSYANITGSFIGEQDSPAIYGILRSWNSRPRPSTDQRMALLDRSHDELALHLPDILDLAQFVDMKVIISVHILRDHFQHKVELARDNIELDHLRQFLDGLDELCARALVMLLQRNIADGHQSLSHLRIIDQGRITEDDAFVLHPLNPLVNGGGAQVYFSRDLPYRDLGILLQQAQDGLVLFIQGNGPVSQIFCLSAIFHVILSICSDKCLKNTILFQIYTHYLYFCSISYL